MQICEHTVSCKHYLPNVAVFPETLGAVLSSGAQSSSQKNTTNFEIMAEHFEKRLCELVKNSNLYDDKSGRHSDVMVSTVVSPQQGPGF